MGSTTLATLPYPEPTDPVAAGADAIKNLALALDPRVAARGVAWGNGAIPVTTAGVAASITVTFPAGRFTAAPRVVCSSTGTTPMTLRGPMASGVSATGATFYAGRDSGTAGVNFDWLAVQ